MIAPTPEIIPGEPRLRYQQAAPEVLQAMLALQQAVNDSGLESSLLELVKLRVSQLNSCAFCLDLHFREALAKGEREERLYLLDAWAETSLYTPRERAALRWADALTRLAGGHVTDADFAVARTEFTEPELTRLTLAIVTINGWNRFGVGFRLTPGLRV